MTDKELRITSSTTNLQQIRDFIQSECGAVGCPEPEIYKIQLAVDEACTNVIKHAYKNDPNHPITIRLDFEGNTLEICISDHGVPFDASHYHTPDLANFIKQRKRGGLGIQLIRSLMDEVRYERQNNQNRVTLVKTIRS